MSLDSDVQSLIDAALVPVNATAKNNTDAIGSLINSVKLLGDRVTALEGATVPVPPPVTPPPASKPWSAHGKVFLKDFTAPGATLGPEFQVATYPDDHPTDQMEKYNRFRHARVPVISQAHGLELLAVKRSDGLYDADLVATSVGKNGRTFGFGVFRYWLSFNLGRAVWQAAWLFDTNWPGNTSEEIDWPELLEGQSLSYHKLGSGAGSKYGLAKPADIGSAIHEFRVERRAGFIAFALDGTEVGRINGSYSPTPLAILLDSKIGFPWAEGPDATTPNPTYLRIAAVTVDA